MLGSSGWNPNDVCCNVCSRRQAVGDLCRRIRKVFSSAARRQNLEMCSKKLIGWSQGAHRNKDFLATRSPSDRNSNFHQSRVLDSQARRRQDKNPPLALANRLPNARATVSVSDALVAVEAALLRVSDHTREKCQWVQLRGHLRQRTGWRGSSVEEYDDLLREGTSC